MINLPYRANQMLGAPGVHNDLPSVVSQPIVSFIFAWRQVSILHALFGLLLLGLTASPPVSAATWRVELDGSGDYESTWDAVWRADAGDTILIGAGRFDTVHHYESHDGAEWDGSVDTHMLLHSRDLTVIGQGPGVTILGNSGLPNIFGIAVVFDYHTDWDAIVRIENLSIESTETGIGVFYNEPIIHVANVEFLSCGRGITAFSS